jgi:SAM-dependent methyltransferase
VTNARFVVADVQAGGLDGGFDYAFSRFGTMFFANPVVTLRKVRRALVPGGRLCMVVWRRKLDNDWLHRAERVVERFLTRPEVTDEPTCGPGPFSMASADTTSDVLVRAGFEHISLHRCDIEIVIGSSLEQAVEFVMALGPAGELIRLAGSDAERRRPNIVAALHASLAELQQPDRTEIRASASTWIVGASSPGARP